MLRELCYDQDLFLIQTAMVLVDPNLILVSMLDRFQLRDWMAGDRSHPECEPAHMAAMVEELLFTLIYCVGDPSNALQLSLEAVCKREIVHALAAGPISFTDLCKRVPERLIEEASFEHVLKEVSVFKKAEGVLDSGSYELKEAYFEEVDPFFYHYTRARREEVESVLKSKLTKAGIKDPVLVPKPYKIASGPYAALQEVLKSPVLLQIIFYTISNFVDGPPLTEGAVSTDAILDQAFHLIMLSITQAGIEFTKLANSTSFSDTTLVQLLCGLEARESMKTFRPRIQWCLDRMSQLDPDLKQMRQVPEIEQTDDTSAEAKRRAAKARQDAIMKQFADAQKKVWDIFDEEEDEKEAADPQEDLHNNLEPCILCQEKMDWLRPFGTITAIHPSRLIRYSPMPGTAAWDDVLKTPESLDRDTPEEPETSSAEKVSAFPSRQLRFGTYGSTCGHMVHFHCFNDYLEAIRSRHRVQPQRHQPECLERGEFICPLCKSLGNCLLPVISPSHKPSTRPPPLAEWLRGLGIELLRSSPDRQLERHQYSSGTGEFMFWAAEDVAWPTDQSAFISGDEIAETVRNAVQMISKQSLRLRTRPEPPYGDRGTGIYIPEGLGAYTLSAIEVAHRGVASDGVNLFVTKIPETAGQCIRGIVAILTQIAAIYFRSGQTFGSIRLAIAKRLLPDWTREEQYRQPFLLRDPFSILFECAAVAADQIPNIIRVLYYSVLLRSIFALILHLANTSAIQTPHLNTSRYSSILGNVAILIKSAARHSPALDRNADRILATFGEARLEQLLYAYTLPALRALLIFTHSICPWAITAVDDPSKCEYERILTALSIPPPAELQSHESIQVLLAGWCTHFGQLYNISSHECSISLDYPNIYRMARLPTILDLMWKGNESGLICPRCNTTPADPAICLICGTLCCHQSYCCRGTDWSQRGECNMHTRE
jgi:E3 ubiquitin-protein ligase UBR1